MKYKREIWAVILLLITGCLTVYSNYELYKVGMRFIFERAKLYQCIILALRVYIVPMVAHILIIVGIIKKKGDKCLIIGFALNAIIYLLNVIGTLTTSAVYPVKLMVLSNFLFIVVFVLSIVMVKLKSKLKVVFWIPGTLLILTHLIGFEANYGMSVGKFFEYMGLGIKLASSFSEKSLLIIEIIALFFTPIISGIAWLLLFSVITQIKTKPEE